MLSQGLHVLLDTYPLLVIAALLFVEELGIPSPIPGDLMMILAGVKVAQGVYPLWLVLLVQEGATLLGSAGLFAVSRRAGRPVVERYGRYVHLGPETLARAEGQIGRLGGRAIVLGRLIPGLRIVTPVAAGTLGVPSRRFFPAVALGGFLYLFALTLLGRLLGAPALALFERVLRATGALVSLLLLLGIVFLVRQIKRELPQAARGQRAAFGAAVGVGVLAGTTALLVTNSAVELLSLGGRLTHQRVPAIAPVLARAEEVSTGWHLVLGWPGFVVVAGVLGALVSALEHGGSGRFSRLGALVLGAGLPLALTLFMVSPLVAHPLPGLARSSGGILLAIETVRWVAYGAALGEYLPVAARMHRRSHASP